ncbi:nuclear transport factor 2 family protein [Kaistia defluvii]|uniref:nuclear transport factor 2 family protein n=1 Tax=Kaistia defluvii TaxID=410841 RepID=UPI0022546756|nr:nuclear transport factor 2 family protein [Kaistia defluvii]MCX5517691.1 nuclear transport factor 2 family protein [Kaistia defluvii]
MTDKLPHPVTAYYSTAAAHDFEALAHGFAVDGVVRDEGAVRTGRAAIATWAANAYAQYKHETEVLGAREQDGVHVVSVRVRGEFPGSPVQLTQRFALAGDEIRSLEIG